MAVKSLMTLTMILRIKLINISTLPPKDIQCQKSPLKNFTARYMLRSIVINLVIQAVPLNAKRTIVRLR